MVELKGRERKVNIDQLSEEQLEELTGQLVEKLTEIAARANRDANRILKIYGLETQVQILKPTPLNTITES